MISILKRENDDLFYHNVFLCTYSLSKSFNPRKVPLLSCEILLFSRFLREEDKNRNFLDLVLSSPAVG